jgi:RHS repeat-associated protein
LDEETGLYYYGARYYDPRISMWYGVDPMAEMMTNTSVYAYCSNNPINIVDPDGLFGIPVHQLITLSAIGSNNLSYNKSQNKIVTANLHLALLGSKTADTKGALQDFHFDGRRADGIRERWAEINSSIEALDLNKVNSGFCRGGERLSSGEMFGILLHNSQDFYAHSNFVEVYIDYLIDFKGVEPGSINLGDIPIYDEAMKDPTFMELSYKLRTGDFEYLKNEYIPGVDKDKLPSTSHAKMNKDEPGKGVSDNKYRGTKFTLFEFAKNAAGRHTKKLVDNAINKANGIE